MCYTDGMRTIQKLLLFLSLWACTSAAMADIEVKPQFEPHEPIVATVTITGVPEGAKLRGSFSVSDGSYLPAGENVYHVWAPPGKHTVSAQGVWVLTKDVTVEGQTFPVLLDFGQFKFEKAIIVGPDVPPVPPPLPGSRWSVIWEETDDRTPQQGNLFLALRKQYQNGQIQIHDVTNLPPDLRALEAQRPQNLPLPVQQVIVRQTDGTDRVIRTVPLPPDVAGFAKELAR